MNIGKIGVWTTHSQFGAERAGEAARIAEQLGYGAFWLGTTISSPCQVARRSNPISVKTPRSKRPMRYSRIHQLVLLVPVATGARA